MNETQAKAELTTKHGCDAAKLDEAKKAGLNWLLILQLIQQYGPTAWAIIQQIIAALNNPTPAPTPTPAP